ncbi:hypothetical protein ISG29_11115 [Nocardioides sp. CBS4Y-1]|uniref:Uncharacterized protein n=1 Tax=Nocardioides acrostichi TaxID=2784339 RepID=A0A930V1Y4_9ACTN|nr:hypothetical protein [Nocardioides acrostichi]
MSRARSSYADLSRDELARLVPELLLIGQLIDRAGMPWVISAFGAEAMTQVAIEEWAGASPHYTRRMQQALGYSPAVDGEGDVVTIFKGLQLDIGAPPQFMDFRYRVDDPQHGEFWLDHCGALLDVEPMGPDYVKAMCHDIEDPTFDATAVATNPRAQVRPIHRPPRVPADRSPHCAWTVIIDSAHPPVSPLPPYYVIEATRAVGVVLDDIDTCDEGASDYAGALLDDFDFAAYSHSALVRMADEVALQMHLLNLSYVAAVQARADTPEGATEICRKQLVALAWTASERIRAALEIPRDLDGALRVLSLHPLLNPVAYVGGQVDRGARTVRVAHGDAHHDGSWVSLVGPGRTTALASALHAVDPTIALDVSGTEDDWTLTVSGGDQPAEPPPEASVMTFTRGSTFEFESRRSLPIFPV